MKKSDLTEEKKKKKACEGATVLPGERDEEGKLKVPHTNYGLFSNMAYIVKKMWQYKRVCVWLILIGAVTQSVMRYLWSYIAKFVIDIVQLQAEQTQKDIKPLVGVLLIALVVEVICMGANIIIESKTWYFIKIRMDMITERIDKVLSMDYQTLEQPHMLNMFQKANNATGSNNSGVEGMMHCMNKMGMLIVTMIVSASAIIGLDWRLIIALTVAMLTNYGSYLLSVKQDKAAYWDKMAPNWRKLSYMERCTQDFDYAKDIRLFNMKNWLLGKQAEVLRDSEKKYEKSRNYWLRHSFIYSFTSLCSGAIMYYILIVEVLEKGLEIGNFTLFLGLCGAFSAALSDFYATVGEIQRCSMQTDDFRTFIDYPTEEGEDFLDLQEVLKGQIPSFEFKNVAFRYEGAEGYALKNLNLSFPAGQRLAVVGLNGAGKTTFIKLLLRLYDVTEGEILLNGVNIQRFKRNDYYKLFAPVFQNVELFAFPMAENVSMLSPEDTDRQLARECIDMAGLKEKVDGFEKGVDTELLKIVHEDGVDLSGGEKQKLALARALYKNAPIIVLDEPTAALDALAEYELYRNFDYMIQDKSAVYISHRLSSTRFCDVIAMFMSGEMVEYGTHEELLAKNGSYAEIFRVQAQYYEEQEGGADER